MPLPSYGEFRRSGQGDDRRRRVLSDTLGDSPDGGTPAGHSTAPQATRTPAEPKSEHYGDASFMDDPLRVTDLIPKRLTSFGLLLLLGLAVIAGLESLHAWVPRLAPYAGAGAAAFGLRGPGSLSVWFSSTVLSLSGLVAILVYNVRRYRNDDYGGRYRIWLWAAMCCFLASIDVTASLHEAFSDMMSRVAGTRVFGDGSVWWIAAWLFLLGGVGLRLAADMRESWLSSAALIGGALAYALAVAARFGLPLGTNQVMIEEGAKLAGALLILMALGLHARHVILDAQGLIHTAADDDEADAEEDDEVPVVSRPRPLRTDLLEPQWGPPQTAHPSPQPPIKRPATPIRPATSAVSSAAGSASKLTGGLGQGTPSDHEKLSKADKKALRKRLLELRQSREQRLG